MTDSPNIVPPAAASSVLKSLVKDILNGTATAAVIPFWLWFVIGSRILGRNRAIEGASQTLSLWPGIVGNYLRRAFYKLALKRCGKSAVIEFGTLFSQADAEIGENVYVGPRCQLGLVRLERDVLVAAGVHIPSGGKTHYYDDPTRPIRDQGGERRLVVIGEGAWIGSAAVVMADVGKGTIVAAGSIVVKPLPDGVVAAGSPARVLRSRFASSSDTIQDEGSS